MSITKENLKKIYESLKIPDIKITATNTSAYTEYYRDVKPVIEKLKKIIYFYIVGESFDGDLKELYSELEEITKERLARLNKEE